MMREAPMVLEIRHKYDALRSGMNEAVRRRWAAAESKAIGRGGITLVSAATGMSRQTIRRGCKELESGLLLDMHRARLPGGGRKKLTQKDGKLLPDLESLVDPVTRARVR
jgi:hypothetical protein